MAINLHVWKRTGCKLNFYVRRIGDGDDPEKEQFQQHGLSWKNYKERQQNSKNGIGSMCIDCHAIQPVSQCIS